MLLAPCGIDCETCNARIATLNNDDNLRKEVAKEWSVEYNFNCTPEMINCTGCLEEGVKVGHCNECSTRKCVLSKDIENCSFCNEYPCEEIKAFHDAVPKLKANLGL